MEYGFAMTQQQQQQLQQRTGNTRRPPLPQVPVQNQNGVYGTGKSPLEMEREARRMVRVRRELERIQVIATRPHRI